MIGRLKELSVYVPNIGIKNYNKFMNYELLWSLAIKMTIMPRTLLNGDKDKAYQYHQNCQFIVKHH